MIGVVCRLIPFVSILLLICSCSGDQSTNFLMLKPEETDVLFENRINATYKHNAYTFRNFYNGGAVALGDINNDGLLDIYLTGNSNGNQLYLNKGNFKFQDITDRAGVRCRDVWNTGAALADVNGDGLLDIFVCKSGPPSKGVRHNELFINNGDLTFTESAETWGVADVGLSIQASFFDYDRDGDLDFYLSSNSVRPVGFFDLYEGSRNNSDSTGGSKLYRNEGTFFSDVSEESNIYHSAIGYGLGVSVADVNLDGWLDIFVANDFFEKDYLYVNQRNGKFLEMSDVSLKSMSMGSMGADISDLNNDGFPEIFVTDMLPSKREDVVTKISFENYNKTQENFRAGYHYQINRNVVHLNQGLIPGDSMNIFFSEIGRMAGVEATDWSWSCILFDFDNDGNRDIFVSNGIYKDLLDQDYIHFTAPELLESRKHEVDSMLLLKLVEKMPQSQTSNFLFRNTGDLTFEKVQDRHLSIPSYSNGAAYGDLNNDGLVDIITNPINERARIYRNVSSKAKSNSFLQLQLCDKTSNNKFGIGSKVTVYHDQKKQYAELIPSRGYLTSVDYKLHFGLGNATMVDSVVVNWPDGRSDSYRGLKLNMCHLIIRDR